MNQRICPRNSSKPWNSGGNNKNMNILLKEQTITMRELKNMRITVRNQWLTDMFHRYADKELVVINMKDLVNAILEAKNK